MQMQSHAFRVRGRVRHGERGNGIAGAREERRCEVGDDAARDEKNCGEREKMQMKEKARERGRERERGKDNVARDSCAICAINIYKVSISGGADRGKRTVARIKRGIQRR